MQPGKLEKTFSLHGERGKLSAHLAEKIVGVYDADKDLDVLAIFFVVVRAGPEGCG